MSTDRPITELLPITVDHVVVPSQFLVSGAPHQRSHNTGR